MSTIKFIRPTTETEESSNGLKVTVDGNSGVVEKVEEKEQPKPQTQQSKPPKDVPIPFNFPSAPETEVKDALKEEPPKRKPGRPPGSGSGKNSGKDKKDTPAPLLSVETLARHIQGIHELANVFFPGAAISKSNAQLLAEQLREVLVAFDIRPNPKIAALVGMVATAAVVEIPVILQIRQNRLEKQSDLKARTIAAQNSHQTIEVAEPYREPQQQPILTAVEVPIAVAEGEPFRG